MHIFGAMMFANIAWNETVGLGHARKGYRSAWEMIEAENPEMWSEFKSNDINAMIDELVEYKQQHFPNDGPSHPSPIRQATPHLFRRLNRIKFFWIKRSSPLLILLVPFVIWIGQCFQVFLVSPNTANIFPWPGSFAFETHRVTTTRIGTQTTFEQDLV